MERSFLFLVTQLRPHPNPLPKAKGVYLILAHCPVKHRFGNQSACAIICAQPALSVGICSGLLLVIEDGSPWQKQS